MSNFFRKVLCALTALFVLQMALPAQAGLFKKLGAVGVAVAGVETAAIASATVDAIAVVGSAAYISSVRGPILPGAAAATGIKRPH